MHRSQRLWHSKALQPDINTNGLMGIGILSLSSYRQINQNVKQIDLNIFTSPLPCNIPGFLGGGTLRILRPFI